MLPAMAMKPAQHRRSAIAPPPAIKEPQPQSRSGQAGLRSSSPAARYAIAARQARYGEHGRVASAAPHPLEHSTNQEDQETTPPRPIHRQSASRSSTRQDRN